MKLFKVIPEGERALVTAPSGRRAVVDGPARVPFFDDVRMFERRVLLDNERGALVDENGAAERVAGPQVVWVHPQGCFRPDTLVPLARHEAVVVIDREGRYRFEKGADNPTVLVTADEKLHEFRWTGSKVDTDYKTPGALRVVKLRLQDTQTYVAYNVRTRDNMVASVHLMLSFRFVDLEKLLVNDDPLGQMFNRVMAEITSHVATLSFDEFKADTEAKVCGIPLLSGDAEATEWLRGLGVEMISAVLREWRPIDPRVQAVLEQAATANAQKAVDEANHERRMTQLKNDEAVLTKEKELEELRHAGAVARGRADGAEVAALWEALKDKVGEAEAGRLARLKVASAAATLCLPPEMLSR
jgi:hypothetical protein